jgi:hypothetical protein
VATCSCVPCKNATISKATIAISAMLLIARMILRIQVAILWNNRVVSEELDLQLGKHWWWSSDLSWQKKNVKITAVQRQPL